MEGKKQKKGFYDDNEGIEEGSSPTRNLDQGVVIERDGKEDVKGLNINSETGLGEGESESESDDGIIATQSLDDLLDNLSDDIDIDQDGEAPGGEPLRSYAKFQLTDG